MRNIYALKLSKYSQFSIIIGGLIFTPWGHATARDLNAGFILDMPTKERFAYIGGVVEGLAYARFLRDRPDETGMKCVNDWYYEGDDVKTWKRIEQWFNRHRDKPVGPLIHVLIKKECGE